MPSLKDCHYHFVLLKKLKYHFKEATKKTLQSENKLSLPVFYSTYHMMIGLSQSNTQRHRVPSFFFSSLLLHLCSLRLCSLLDFPDGDLAVTARRATQDVAILCRAERLDTVRMGLQLLFHSVGLWINHQHLTSQLTVTLTPDTTLATTTYPDLRGAEDN